MKLQIKKAKWVAKIFEDAKILVKENEEIKKGDVLMTSEKGTVKSFDASFVLSRVPKEKLEEFTESWKGREIFEGDLLYGGSGLFPKKIFSFYSGVFLGVDEFFNVHIEERNDIEKRKILSPVDGKIAKIDEENVTLEFRAIEFNGEGIIEGKAWGESSFKEVNKINDLNSSLDGQIIVTKNFDTAFLTKAEVVGIAGLIIDKNDKEKFDKIETRLPILALEKDEIEGLESKFNEEKEKRVLLNSKTGRLLISME